jgi:hypothetical protein
MIDKIKENETYKEILKDSFGGIMYNLDNRDKYETTELLKLWSEVPEHEKEASGGITKGVFEFLRDN